jgi:hypothetical protein
VIADDDGDANTDDIDDEEEEAEDEDDGSRFGSASNCISNCIMLKDSDSRANSANISLKAEFSKQNFVISNC